MALAAKLQLRQSQSLVMTPQLVQSIRLLQMTHVELERFVEEEIERNPLLDRVEAREETPQVGDGVQAGSDDWAGSETDWSAETMSQVLDASLENVFPDDPGTADRIGPDLSAQWKSAGSHGVAMGDDFDMEGTFASVVTLRDHVAGQIALAFSDPVERMIARNLADALDEVGYLRDDPAEIAEQLGVEEETVLSVLKTCQSFEPAGIFARDLAECLALQLARRDRLDPAMRALIDNLELLARRDFQVLKKLCGVDEEDLVEMMAEIHALDPRPGTAFAGSGAADAIVPDVDVRPASDGSWAVELNSEALPRVLVNQAYFARVSSHTKDQAEKDFLSECLQNASWLTRSLDQRAKTILKVASEIVRQQDAFLMHGVRYLRPLNLRTVAEAIGMHESTISRVTANKYMLTPRGVFELRYFFTAAIAAAGEGDAHSAEAVRDRIRQLVDEEAGEVLSDDSIVDILRREGIDIARRTVAKYRESMNIPSSVQRRREKRALAVAGR